MLRFAIQSIVTVALLPTTCWGETVAHWTFEEGFANFGAVAPSSILDSAHELHGSPVGTPTYCAVSLPGSKLALQFDGIDDRVAVADDLMFRLTHSLTLEASVMPLGVPSDQFGGSIIFRGDARGGLDSYVLRVRQDGRAQFIIDGHEAGDVGLVSPQPLASDHLQHVAGTLDDVTGLMKLFVEGIEVARTITVIRAYGILDAASFPGVGIGGINSGGQYFPGLIDEVRISDTALNPSQFLFPPSPGDANGNRVADGADYTIWADHFLQSTDAGAAAGDFSGNGFVDGGDYTIWADNYAPAVFAFAVPEPSTLALGGIGGLSLLARRSYRRSLLPRA